MGTWASETASFLLIEQAIAPQIVPQIVPAERRSAVFAQYNLVASFAGPL